MVGKVGVARGARWRRRGGAAVGTNKEAGDLDGEEDGEGRLDKSEELGSLGAILRQHFELLQRKPEPRGAGWR